jgi:hypothetical protein
MEKIICAVVLCVVLSLPTIGVTRFFVAARKLRFPDLSNTSRPIEQTAERSQKSEKPQDEVPTECEGAMARLDFAVIDTKKLPGAYLIIVARLGRGESSRLNRIRLAAAEEYVLRRGNDLKYVLAAGARTKGLGRLELYVGGQLKEIMTFEKNAKGYCIHEGS